uniref:Helicase-associated domain-containing protein n=1 Tax=Romanomermis culicivorax TaxID=13658 RepID=A0A915IA12_ROMCU
ISAVDELIDLNFLDNDRKLTPLGRRLAALGCSPYLAKAMLYAIFLKCSDPVLSIVSMLELNSDVFINSPDVDRSAVNRAKLDQMGSTFSDHLLLAKIYEQYSECIEKSKISYTKNLIVNSGKSESNLVDDFCRQNYLNAQALALASELKSLFSKQLQSAGIVDENDDLLRQNSDFNQNRRNFQFITAALAAGLEKNFENRRNIQFRAGCLDLLKNSLNDDMEKSKYQNDVPSNSDPPSKKHDFYWFNTFERVLSVDGRTFRLEDLGLVNPLLVLLFSGFDLELYGNSNIILHPSKDFRFQLPSAA